MKISICAPTHRRPEGLHRLLTALDSLEFVPPDPTIEVIVVDNDPDRGAAEICDRIRTGFRWELHYDVEPRRGVVHVRNRALQRTSADSDWIAFIDDDEVPEPSWLAELLRIQEQTGADVVTGPVEPYFPAPVPEWIEAGGFFRQRRYPDGCALPRAFTNNVLFRASIRDDPRLQPAFADHYALSGGEDHHFFERVHRAGYTMHWADRAVVTEWVPATRTSVRWLVRRQFRVGNVAADLEAEFDPGWPPRLKRFARACYRLLGGVVTLPLVCLQGKARTVQACQHIASDIGRLGGMCGWRYQEYRKVHR